MAVELSDSDTVGTALTLQMALGFTVTVVGIFTIPLVEVRGFVCTSMQIWFFVCASWGCFGLRAACNALGISSPGQAHFDSPMCLLFHFLFFLSPPHVCMQSSSAFWRSCGRFWVICKILMTTLARAAPIFVRSSQKATSWAWTTVFLVPGPVLGIALIAALRMSPDAAKMSNGKG